jgi:prepilin-type N-terminal cleavage/methylation domain-containing protein
MMTARLATLTRPMRSRQAGFTLIELMVASVVFVAVLGVLLTFLGRDERAREVTYYVAESRQSARSALEFMVSEIRMAGSGISVPVVTSLDSGDSLILYPVTPDTICGRPEKVTILGQFEGVETTVSNKMPNASSVTDVESTDGFVEGDLVVITNGSFANLFEVTQVVTGSEKLQHNPTSPFNQPGGHKPWPPGGYDIGSRVFKVGLVSYYVDRQDTTCPSIMRQEGTQDPRIVSEYIKALEIEYELGDGSVATMPSDPSLIRRVIVTIEAASNEPTKQHVTRLKSAAKPRCL